jgi:hypothetical protein
MASWKDRVKHKLDWLSHGYLLVQILGSGTAGTLVRGVLITYTHLSPVWIMPIWLGASALVLAGMIFVGKRVTAPHDSPSPQVGLQPPSSSSLQPGVPALSFLLGQEPQITFNAKQYFAQAYYSPLTVEFERNFKIIAERDYPNDRENFYAKFIGVGVAAYMHDVTFFTIYKSQVRALEELNFRVMVPLSDVRKHYDKAVIDFPQAYANYPFENWLSYMSQRFLVLRHPSDMVEVTHGGKDFLRYVSHKGWNFDGKRN